MDVLNSYTLFQNKTQVDDFNKNLQDDGHFLYKLDPTFRTSRVRYLRITARSGG